MSLNDLEQQLISLQREYHVAVTDRNRLNERFQNLSQQLHEKQDFIVQLEKSLLIKDMELQQQNSKYVEVAEVKEALQQSLERKNEECSRLREQIKDQSNEIVEERKVSQKLQVKVSDLQSELIPKQFELTKLSQEKLYLEKELEFHRTQLLQRENEDRLYRKESSEQISKLENEIISLKHSLDQKITKIAALETEVTSQGEKIRDYIQKLKEEEEKRLTDTSSLEQENLNLQKLVNLYKSHFEEATQKIEELESANELQRDKFRQFETLRDNEMRTVTEYKKQTEEETRRLTTRIAELEDEISRPRPDSLTNVIPSTTSTAALVDLSVTELYDQMMQLQREFIEEQNKRHDTEVYLNQILRDIEAKAPLIAKQRRDYQRIVQSHSQLTEALDAATDEAVRLKATVQELEGRVSRYSKEASVLSATNADLVQQVQHLLRLGHQQKATREAGNRERFSSTGYSEDHSELMVIEGEDIIANEPQDIITSHLVTFDGIEELQQRNVQLLQTIRRLTTEREQQEVILQEINNQQRVSGNQGPSLSDLQNQFRELRSDYEKAEAMIKVLAQQRDLYRSMVTTGNYSAIRATSSSSPNSPGNAIVSSSSPNLGSEDQEVELLRLRNLCENLTQEKQKMLDRLSRFEESDQQLHEELSRTKNDLVQSKIQASNAQLELRFLTERSDRAESQVKLLQVENTESLKRRSELEENIVHLQKELRNKDDLLHQNLQEMRSLRDSLRKREVDLEVTRSSESRLLAQISEIKEELQRNSSLTEHLHRIESSLSSRVEEEREFYRQEKDTVKAAFEAYRDKMDQKVISQDQQLRLHEKELQAMSQAVELKEQELRTLQKSLQQEQSSLAVANERVRQLERQVAIADEKMNQASGKTISDSVIETELREKEVLLSKALNEVDSLKALLKIAESHVDQFKKLAAANEVMIKELSAARQQEQVSFEQQSQSNQQELSRMKEEVASQQSRANQLLSELESTRQELQAVHRDRSERIEQISAEVQRLTHENQTLLQSHGSHQQELDQLQRAAQTSFENYERELQLHAEAEKNLREERLLHAKTKEKLHLSEEKIGQLSADFIRLQQQSQEEIATSRDEISRLNELLVNVKQANDLLHSQVDSYGQQLEKFQSERYSSMTEMAGVSSSDVAEGSPAVPAEEYSHMQKSLAEMRELLRYFKREQEMLQAKQKILESQNSRYQSQWQSAQKTVEELRSELKTEMDKQATFRSEEEFQLLMAEVQQLNVLRESNLHLRKENDEVLKKWRSSQEEVDSYKQQLLPLEQTIRRLQLEKDALELSNDQLTNDISYWKNRLHSLVSRYNDIDPHEHQQLVKRLEDYQTLIQSLESTISELKASKEEMSQSKDKEIESAKAAAKGFENNATALRDKLRQFKEKNAELDGKLKDLAKSVSAKDAANAALELQLKETQTKVSELTSEVSTLKAAAVPSTDSTKGPPSKVATRSAAKQKRPPPPAGQPPVAATTTVTNISPSSAATPSVPPATDSQSPPPVAVPPTDNSETNAEVVMDKTESTEETSNKTAPPASVKTSVFRQLMLQQQKRKSSAVEEPRNNDTSASSTNPTVTTAEEDQPRVKRSKIADSKPEPAEPASEVMAKEKDNEEGDSSAAVPSSLRTEDSESPNIGGIENAKDETNQTSSLNINAAPFAPFKNPFALPAPASLDGGDIPVVHEKIAPDTTRTSPGPIQTEERLEAGADMMETEEMEEGAEEVEEHEENVDMSENVDEPMERETKTSTIVPSTTSPVFAFGSLSAGQKPSWPPATPLGINSSSNKAAAIFGSATASSSGATSTSAGFGFGLFGAPKSESTLAGSTSLFATKPPSAVTPSPFGSIFGSQTSNSTSQVNVPIASTAPVQSIFGSQSFGDPSSSSKSQSLFGNLNNSSTSQQTGIPSTTATSSLPPPPQVSEGEIEGDEGGNLEDAATEEHQQSEQTSLRDASPNQGMMNNNPFNTEMNLKEKMEQRALRFGNPATISTPVSSGTAAATPAPSQAKPTSTRKIPISRGRTGSTVKTPAAATEQKEGEEEDPSTL